MKYLIAHDLGTSGNKAVLFSEKGELIKSSVESYDCHYFNGNWAEQEPGDWWEAVCNSTKKILEGIDPEDVAAVSFSGQMMGCLCVDKNGEPLYPHIIWADQRAEKEAAHIAEKISPLDFYKLTGHRNSASYGIQKLAWIKNNKPEVYENTYKVLNAKDYITYKLTGVFCTEYSDGASTACVDINTLKWSEEIAEAAGIDADKLPDMFPSTHIAGGVTEAAAKATGLAPGTPVVLGGGDGCCATIGAGCVGENDIYCVMGSSAWIAYNDEKPFYDENLLTFNWPSLIPGVISPTGSMQAAGVSYAWMRDVLCTGEKMLAEQQGVSIYSLINNQISDSSVGANGLMYLPYLLGERSPRWNPNARGAFVGLKREHTRKDVLRSVMEGITMNMGIILGLFSGQRNFNRMTVIGGAMKSPEWQQIMADVFDMPLAIPNYLEEATSMGAAITGGVGCGLFKDFTAIDRFIKIERTVEPNADNAAVYKKLMPIFDEAYFALCDVYDKLAKF